MAGSQQYTDKQIVYILTAYLAGKSNKWIKHHFDLRFNKLLTENQIRYLKNKYGKDPRFNTPAANGMANRRNGYTDHEHEWGDDSCLQIDYSIFNDDENATSQPVIRVTAPARASAAAKAIRTPATPITPSSEGSPARTSVAVAPVTPTPFRGITTIAAGAGTGAAHALPTPASGVSEASSVRKQKKRRRGNDNAGKGAEERNESSDQRAHKIRRVGSPSVHDLDSLEHAYGAHDQDQLKSLLQFSSPLHPIQPNVGVFGHRITSVTDYDPFVEHYVEEEDEDNFNDSGFIDYNPEDELGNVSEFVTAGFDPAHNMMPVEVQGQSFDTFDTRAGGIALVNETAKDGLFSTVGAADLNTDWAYMPFDLGNTYITLPLQPNTNLLPQFNSISEGVKTSLEVSQFHHAPGTDYAQQPVQAYPVQTGQLIYLTEGADESIPNTVDNNDYVHYQAADGAYTTQQQVDCDHTSANSGNTIDAERQAAFDAVMAKLADAPYDGSAFVRQMEAESARFGVELDTGVPDQADYDEHDDANADETAVKSFCQESDAVADMAAIPEFPEFHGTVPSNLEQNFSGMQAGVPLQPMVNQMGYHGQLAVMMGQINPVPAPLPDAAPQFQDILDIFDVVAPSVPGQQWPSFEEMLNGPFIPDFDQQDLQVPNYDISGAVFDSQTFLNSMG